MNIGETYLILKVGPRYTMKPYKIHIAAIVDGHMIVFKWFSKSKQCWRYEIMDEMLLQMDIERCAKFKEERRV